MMRYLCCAWYAYKCNGMNFSERIEAVMRHYNLQPRELADKCGVQRTAINHIINGRNRPSVGFLMALSESFPELNTRWLLHGAPPMFTNVTSRSEAAVDTTPKQIETSVTAAEAPMESANTLIETGKKDLLSEVTSVDTSVTGSPKSTNAVRRVVQVIVCYSDGSFTHYRPQE
jgi:transcriptional regulator with XRE-family HTH domain